ncbi:histidine kinase [Alcaligenaceae bacterium]|nr:histidine kinase [Alcaligenaceae bacterium]
MNLKSISQEFSRGESSLGFWRAQVLGWSILAAVGFCIRLAIFGNITAALWLTLALEPVAFALTSVAAVALSNRPFRNDSIILTFVCVAMLCALAAAVLSSISYFVNDWLMLGELRVAPDNRYRLAFLYYLGIFSIWALIYLGVRAELAARNDRISKMKAETRAVRLELEHLRIQIEPHFLFNALNTIVVEIADRPAIAEEMTRRLADYLRYSLDKRGLGACRLDEEIEAAETYIRIQALRFDKVLAYQSQIDPAALDMHLPHMTLQGLVENAIKHGMQTGHEHFLINICVRCVGDELIVEVDNPGRLHAPSGTTQRGGLSNLCRRLALHYPDRHEFSLNQRDGRIVARVSLRGGPVSPLGSTL